MNMRWLLAALFLAIATTAPAQDQPRPGIAVESSGNRPIDPSENVKALSEAANKRQDDLRQAAERLFQAQIDSLEKINTLRYIHAQELAKLLADKLESEAKLRAEYADRLSNAEAKRIDAIRLVDTGNVAVATERATTTASTLAKTVTDSALVLSGQVAKQADDLRTLVATTAAESNRNLASQFGAVNTNVAQIATRVSALEQSGAEGLGKQKLQDPATLALVAEVHALTQSRQDQAGRSEGIGAVVGWIVGGLGLLVGLIGAFVAIFAAFRGSGSGGGGKRGKKIGPLTETRVVP